MSLECCRIGLGTVQFGLDYGISNQQGKTPPVEVAKTIAKAASLGIRYIDTAASYGTSESAIGLCGVQLDTFRIITKTPRMTSTRDSAERARLVEQTFTASLDKLGRRAVYGLLAHNADDLLEEGGDSVYGAMLRLKNEGKVRKVGVSVYTGRQIEQILERFDIDLIQIPINVFDQRLLQGGQIQMLKERNVEIHARSAFLQGLLLMEPERLPEYFDSVRRHLAEFQEFLKSRSVSRIQGALGFVLGIPGIDAVICGVNNCCQLDEICAAAKPADTREYSRFALRDEGILNPAKWKK